MALSWFRWIEHRNFGGIAQIQCPSLEWQAIRGWTAGLVGLQHFLKERPIGSYHFPQIRRLAAFFHKVERLPPCPVSSGKGLEYAPGPNGTCRLFALRRHRKGHLFPAIHTLCFAATTSRQSRSRPRVVGGPCRTISWREKLVLWHYDIGSGIRRDEVMIRADGPLSDRKLRGG